VPSFLHKEPKAFVLALTISPTLPTSKTTSMCSSILFLLVQHDLSAQLLTFCFLFRTITIDWCNLPSDTSYLLTLVAEGSSSTIGSLAVSVQTNSYTSTTIAPSTPISDSVTSLGYKSYLLPIPPQNGQMVLTLSQINGGTLTLLSTSSAGNLATSSCSAPTLLSCPSSSCTVVLNQCNTVSGFTIVANGGSSGLVTVTYTLNLVSYSPATLIANTQSTFTLDGTLSLQFLVPIPVLPPNTDTFALNLEVRPFFSLLFPSLPFVSLLC
jgi:hypothetical protein